MAAIKKAYFDAPGGQLHYRYLFTIKAAKKPPCVFLHMSASSSRHYESMMKVHADKGRDCYAPDMLGYVVL
jgi:pimeloyl-ACP methyl ester carboxylesterase